MAQGYRALGSDVNDRHKTSLDFCLFKPGVIFNWDLKLDNSKKTKYRLKNITYQDLFHLMPIQKLTLIQSTLITLFE